MKSQSRAAGGGRRQWQSSQSRRGVVMVVKETDAGFRWDPRTAWKAKHQNYSELKDKVRECLARRKQADGSLDKNSDEETIIEVILTAPENQSDKENWAEIKQGRSFLMEHGHTLHL